MEISSLRNLQSRQLRMAVIFHKLISIFNLLNTNILLFKVYFCSPQNYHIYHFCKLLPIEIFFIIFSGFFFQKPSSQAYCVFIVIVIVSSHLNNAQTWLISRVYMSTLESFKLNI